MYFSFCNSIFLRIIEVLTNLSHPPPVFQDSQAPTVKRETPAPRDWTAPVCREKEELPASLVLRDSREPQDLLEGPVVTAYLDFKVQISHRLL